MVVAGVGKFTSLWPGFNDESVCIFGDLRGWLDESQSAGRY